MPALALALQWLLRLARLRMALARLPLALALGQLLGQRAQQGLEQLQLEAELE